MDFNKWLSRAIKQAELEYIYTESVRGVVDTETRLQRERLQTLKRVREVYDEFSREMDSREPDRRSDGSTTGFQ
jgi:hypothetical protein